MGTNLPKLVDGYTSLLLLCSLIEKLYCELYHIHKLQVSMSLLLFSIQFLTMALLL